MYIFVVLEATHGLLRSIRYGSAEFGGKCDIHLSEPSSMRLLFFLFSRPHKTLVLVWNRRLPLGIVLGHLRQSYSSTCLFFWEVGEIDFEPSIFCP